MSNIFEQSQLALRSNPNLFINGDFSVWQRGTTFSNIGGQYTADRWYITALSDITDVSLGAAFALGNTYPFLAINPSVHDGNLGIAQRIENVSRMAGKTVTVSIMVYTDELSQFDAYHGHPGNFSWVGEPQSVEAGSWKKTRVDI
tara:strand:- start:659 stop:1093 length:435 start_codon:yes stop_codon:yes gene_type:complete